MKEKYVIARRISAVNPRNKWFAEELTAEFKDDKLSISNTGCCNISQYEQYATKAEYASTLSSDNIMDVFAKLKILTKMDLHKFGWYMVHEHKMGLDWAFSLEDIDDSCFKLPEDIPTATSLLEAVYYARSNKQIQDSTSKWEAAMQAALTHREIEEFELTPMEVTS